MAGPGNIKGITIEIAGNTDPLQKALKGVTNESIGVQKELQQVEKLLKFNPGNAELAAQKTELLSKQVEATSEKLKILKEAQAQVDAQFAKGDISAENYRAFNRELVNTETSLNNLQTKLAATGQAQKDLENKTKQLDMLFKATGTSVEQFSNELGVGLTNAIKNGTASSRQLDTAIERIGKAALGAGADVDEIKKALKTIDDGASVKSVEKDLKRISKAADDATRDTKNLKSELKNLGSGLGATGAAVGAAAGGLVTGMQEYNQDLARLRTNAELAGNDLGLVEEAFKQITVVTGETDSAVETVSNLLATGFKDNQLAGMIDQINGAAIKFSDTLKTEGIADGIQETFATGEAVGQFGELLERSGVDIEGFNEKLQAAQKQGKGTELVMQTMADLGFGAVTEKYKEMNPEVQRNAEANANLQSALANLALILTPLVATVTEAVTKIAEWATKNPELTATITAVVSAVGILMGIFTALAPIIGAVIAAGTGVGAAIGGIMIPVLAVIAGIGLLIAAGVAIYQNWDTIKAKSIEVWGSIKEFLSATWEGIKVLASTVWEGIKVYFTTVLEVYKTIFTTAWSAIKTAISTVWNGIKTLATTIWDGIKTYFTTVLNVYKTLFTNAWNGIKTVTSTVFNAVKSSIQTVWNGIQNVFSTVLNTIKTVVTTVWNAIKSTISTVMNGISSVISSVWNGAKNTVTTVVNGIKTIVSTVFNSLKEVVTTAMDNVKNAIEKGWDKAQSFLEGINLLSIGKDIMNGLLKGIDSMASVVWDKVKGIAESIKKAFTDMLDINSPSKVFEGYGVNINEGLINGIESSTRKLMSAMDSVYGSMSSSAREMMQTSSVSNSNSRTYDQSRNIQQTINITAMNNDDIVRKMERVNRRLAFEFRG